MKQGPPWEREPRAWPLWLGLGLVAFTGVFFHRALLSPDIFASRDLLRVYYPLRQYWVERLSGLEYPDWYPYDGLGQPFTGMVISGAFHPSNLLYLLLRPGLALELNVLACYPLAAAGAYACARLWGARRPAAVFAALGYAFCGYQVSISNNLLYLMAASTTPWALWASERAFRGPSAGRLGLAALLCTLVLFAGDSQAFAVCCTLVLLLGLVRADGSRLGRRLAVTGGLLGFTALLGAAQLLPALHVLSQAQAGANTLNVALRYSLHPVRLAELLLGPLFLGDEGMLLSRGVAELVLKSELGNVWSDSVHLGLLPVALAVLALGVHRRHPRAWLLAAVAGAFLVMALGRFGGLYARVFEWVPLWRPFRYPEKLLPWLLLILSVGAALGLEALEADEARRQRFGRVLLALGAACGVAVGLEVFWHVWSAGVLGWVSARPMPEDIRAQLGGRFIQGALATGVGLGVAWGVLTRARTATGRLLGLGAVQGLGLFLANGGVYQLTVPEVLEQKTAFVQLIAEREGGTGLGRGRVLAGSMPAMAKPPGMREADVTALQALTSLQPVTPALEGLEGANTYLPAVGRYVPLPEQGMGRWLGRLGPLYGVRFVSLPEKDLERLGGREYRPVSRLPELSLVLLEAREALPRAYLAREHCVADADAAWRRLLSADFRPGLEATVECAREDGSAAPAGSESPGGARVLAYEPERVELEVEASRSALLVLNDAWYGGWSATVDGAAAEVLRANLAVRGVRVSEGRHRVVFSYRTPWAREGLGLTALGLLALGAVALWERGRARGPGWWSSDAPG